MEKKPNEQIFLEHIAAKIEILTDAYTHLIKQLDTEKMSASADTITADVSYKILLGQLNAAINDFKREMKRCLKDYYIICTNKGHLDEGRITTHLKSKLDALHREQERLGSQIPQSVLKKQLGHNYYFHAHIKKLTPKVLITYFETNYTLSMEEDL